VKPATKPCPFCANPPRWSFEPVTVDHTEGTVDRIGCPSIHVSLACGCRAHPHVEANADFSDGIYRSDYWLPGTLESTVQDVANIWNTQRP
jgi:hypothetical protein